MSNVFFDAGREVEGFRKQDVEDGQGRKLLKGLSRPIVSVTRFGEISPLWKILERLWHIFNILDLGKTSQHTNQLYPYHTLNHKSSGC